MKPIRLLILTPNPLESASTRYRIAQFLPYLSKAGITGVISPFLDSELFNEIYRPGISARKITRLLAAIRQRFQLLLTAGDYDCIFISREIMTIGPAIHEWILSKAMKIPLVFDFDDATWVPYDSPTYGNLVRLIKPVAKTSHIISFSQAVIAGNSYLAAYASRFNSRVTIIPTVVDSELFRPTTAQHQPKRAPVIGWIGSHSTAQYLRLITNALQIVAKRENFTFKVIGAGMNIDIDGVTVDNRDWDLQREMEDFRSLDIGVYPIVEDEWSIGKCAFKAIQYQAAGVACIASPVGMTSEVIEQGRTGILAKNEREWVDALEYLLSSPQIRQQMGQAGIESVRAKYSLQVHAPRLAEVIQQAVSQRS